MLFKVKRCGASTEIIIAMTSLTGFNVHIKNIRRVIYVVICLLLFSAQQLFAAQEPIKIAAIYASSGIAASHNAPMVKMTRLAVERINTNGGVLGREIELVFFDNKSTPIGAAVAAQKAIESGVVAVIGGYWSSHSLAMAPYFQAAQIPMISPGSTNPEVTLVGDYIFRTCFLDSFQGRAMANFAIDELGAKNAAIVTNVDELYCTTLADYFKNSFLASSGKIVADLQYRGDATDFSHFIGNLKRVNPDVIYLPGYTRDSGLFIKQARKMGLSSIFLGGDAWNEITALTGLDINGSYQTAPWHPNVSNERSVELRKLYVEKFGYEMSNYSSPLAYDAVMLLKTAIEKSQSTEGSEIRDALFMLDKFEGATGNFAFDKNGDPEGKEVIIIQFKGLFPEMVKSLNSQSNSKSN